MEYLNFGANVYSLEQWKDMEDAGAHAISSGAKGFYWTCTPDYSPNVH